MSQQFRWRTTDGTELFVTHHLSSQPKATLFLTHGWGDHQGRYADAIRFFNENEYSFIAYDMRGHGRSEGKRGYASGFDTLRDDLHGVITRASELIGDTPLFLYGQSFGGLLALNYLLQPSINDESRQRIVGTVITSPLLGLEMHVPGWKLFLGKMLSMIFPEMTLRAGIDVTKLSHNPDYASKIAADPLRQSRISAQVFFGMLKAMIWTMENAGALSVPTMLMHGDADRITSHLRSQAFAKASPEHVDLQIWPGMYHELHAEVESQTVFEVISTWLDEQVNL